MRTRCPEVSAREGGEERSTSELSIERSERLQRLREAIAAGEYYPPVADVAATLVWAWQGHWASGTRH